MRSFSIVLLIDLFFHRGTFGKNNYLDIKTGVFMDYLSDLIIQIELHSVEGIKNCFENGVDPNQLFRGKPLIDELTSEYTRSPRFKSCVQTFVDFGLEFEDKALLAVLLDDSNSLEKLIQSDASIVHKLHTLKCAYTPLETATLLHICAEFNHLACAQVLVKYGADINAPAGQDSYGFGGQSPLFHTVNQNTHQSEAMFEYLLSLDVDLDLTVRGLIWGKDYPWETLIPAVNPISYAMFGFLPQMHRREAVVNQVVLTLLKKRYGIEYPVRNIPNEYLSR